MEQELINKQNELAAKQAELAALEVNEQNAEAIALLEAQISQLQAEIASLENQIEIQEKQDELDALGDLSLLISKYISQNSGQVTDSDSYNVAGFTGATIDTSFGWNFQTLAKPTTSQLTALKPTVDAETISSNDLMNRIKRQDFGRKVIAIMSIRNDAKNLNSSQIVQFAQDYADINMALLNGSIATAKALIQAITPDGVITTQADKDVLVAEINANEAQLGY